MEENLYTQEPVQSENLKLGQLAKTNLAGAAKWGKFVAILGFISSGLMAVMAFSAKVWTSSLLTASGGTRVAAYGNMQTGVFTGTYLVIAVIYFFLALFLYRFSTKAQRALAAQDSGILADSFGNLNNLFRLYGILCIVALAFVVLTFIVVAIAGVAAIA